MQLSDLKQHLVSKTNGALLLLLAVVVGLAVTDHLTEPAVEAIKWLGTSFFGVRGVANVMENIGNKDV